jgi:tRNA pseudouridine55 synthase
VKDAGEPVAGGLVIVDKDSGCTSHDVVARLRRLASTRRVGHAGTLDPAATGVLVCGVGRATRLLGHLLLAEKEYEATIRLGVTTSTDDAEGEVLSRRPAAGVTDSDIAAQLPALTGPIDQVPSSVSAIKVGGVRAYTRVRAGEEVHLAPRRVTVHRFDVLARRGDESDLLDLLDVVVTCSSGTYIRALARDLGEALGCGAHLTALRRTRVGSFSLEQSRTLEQLAADFVMLPLGEAVDAMFTRRDVDAVDAMNLRHGRPLAPSGVHGPVGVFDPDGQVLALVEDSDQAARPLVVLRPA